jgi:hypothetical protein
MTPLPTVAHPAHRSWLSVWSLLPFWSLVQSSVYGRVHSRPQKQTSAKKIQCHEWLVYFVGASTFLYCNHLIMNSTLLFFNLLTSANSYRAQRCRHVPKLSTGVEPPACPKASNMDQPKPNANSTNFDIELFITWCGRACISPMTKCTLPAKSVRALAHLPSCSPSRVADVCVVLRRFAFPCLRRRSD